LAHNLYHNCDETAANILGSPSHEIAKVIDFACDSPIDCGSAYSVIVDGQSAAANMKLCEFGWILGRIPKHRI